VTARQFVCAHRDNLLAFLIRLPGANADISQRLLGRAMPDYPGSGVRYELFEHSRTGHGDLFINTGAGLVADHLAYSLRFGWWSRCSLQR